MIDKSTMKFLKDLKKNNNKDWFDENRKQYQIAKDDFAEFVASLLEDIAKFDPRLKGTEAKDCIFRIFRDVRFSKDKTPYKSHFGANMAPGGRKGFLGGYYLHVDTAGESMIAGGSYHPEPDQLAAIRQEIDYNIKEFKAILNKKDFKTNFGELEDFDKLKRVPKGYDADHPEAELLKLRS
jgi:uncharacterized protein (TIGR02453 family)